VIQSNVTSIINKSNAPNFLRSLKRLLYSYFAFVLLATMISMLTMADRGDDNSKVKIMQPPPTV